MRTRTLGGEAGLRQEHKQFIQNHQRGVKQYVGRNAGRGGGGDRVVGEACEGPL